MTFKTILVAYDGSDHAREALGVACDLAKVYAAQLHIINTPQIANETMIVGYATVPVPPTADELEKAGQMTIEQAQKAAAEHGIAKPVVAIKAGDPGRMIVEYAKAENVDMIVMGRRGLGQLGSLLVGSVTHKVSQLADCAVLTVK